MIQLSESTQNMIIKIYAIEDYNDSKRDSFDVVFDMLVILIVSCLCYSLAT